MDVERIGCYFEDVEGFSKKVGIPEPVAGARSLAFGRSCLLGILDKTFLLFLSLYK